MKAEAMPVIAAGTAKERRLSLSAVKIRLKNEDKAKQHDKS